MVMKLYELHIHLQTYSFDLITVTSFKFSTNTFCNKTSKQSPTFSVVCFIQHYCHLKKMNI